MGVTARPDPEDRVTTELLVYPTDKVVGIVADRAGLERACAALTAVGVDPERVEALCGPEGSAALDADGDEHGPLATALRVVQKVLGEETPRLEKLERAVEAGAVVVQVALPHDLDADAADAEKHRIGQALTDAGAREVAFYGRWAVQELQLGA